MGLFKSQKRIPIICKSLHLVSGDVLSHFQAQAFEVAREETTTGGWEISIRKGGSLKAILGLKTALKINIEPESDGTLVKAGIGIFGQQALPTVATLVLRPLAVTQIWGMVKQAHLDDEAMQVIERSLEKHAGANSSRFCTSCGSELRSGSKFCDACGAELVLGSTLANLR